MGYLDTYEFDGQYVTWTTDGENAGTVFAREGRFNCTNVCGTIKLKSGNHFFVAAALSRVAGRHVSRHVGNPKLMNGVMRKIRIALPATCAEQDAIATALRDMDALLVVQDALIAKKRAIKQGAMQELLTGKRRLPGLSGMWEVKRLGDCLTICHGKSQHDVAVLDGAYPILATGGQIGTASRPLYDKPSVLIGRKGTIDRPQYMEQPFWTVDTLFYCSMKDGNLAKFFYYRFCLIDWMQLNESSGVPSLNARTIEQVEVDAPNPDEQFAIVRVLADLDAEIADLEIKRAKAALLKQGMMQELLTGRIRLV